MHKNCRYCAIKKDPQTFPDPKEPERVAEAVTTLNLQYIVITSVTRDDVEDGGASHFRKTINAIRRHMASAKIEVLFLICRETKIRVHTFSQHHLTF